MLQKPSNQPSQLHRTIFFISIILLPLGPISIPPKPLLSVDLFSFIPSLKGPAGNSSCSKGLVDFLLFPEKEAKSVVWLRKRKIFDRNLVKSTLVFFSLMKPV
jgi:hypothetical protein